METVNILGVEIACLDQAGLIDQALAWSQSAERRVIYYANAHVLNLVSENPKYRQYLKSADLVYADGASLVFASRLLGGASLTRLTGADWIEPLCARAAAQGVSLYLLGGGPGIAGQAALNLLNRYPSLKISGAADGFFQERSVAQITSEIASARPQIVLVGMGSPVQWQWIDEHRSVLTQGVWWGVGALFDFVAGAERRAPGWMNRLGLEWLYRLAQDPVGKWRRYLLGNPRFVFRVLVQSLSLQGKI